MTTRALFTPGPDLPRSVVGERLGFLGRTGSGKTYAGLRLVEILHDMGAQFVVLDPVGVWGPSLRLAHDGKAPGIAVPVIGGLHGDVPLEASAAAGALVADLAVDSGTSLVIDVSQFEHDTEKARVASSFIARFFFRKKAAPSPVHLILEEAQEFVPQNPAKGEEAMLGNFIRAAKIGRNFGIGLSLLSQRPQEVNKKALNLVELLFAFQLTGPHERKVVTGWMSEHGLDAKIADLLPALEVGHAYAWSPGWLKISAHVRITKRWTFDGSSTPKDGGSRRRALAPIDMEVLRKQMSGAVEHAKENDPELLREQIVRLKRELALAKERSAKAPKPKPLFTAAERKRIETAYHGAEKVLGDVVKKLTALGEAYATIAARATEDPVYVHTISGAELQVRAVAAKKLLEAMGVPRREGKGLRRHSWAAIAPPEGDTRLPKGERAILTAVAQTRGGLTRQGITALTGYRTRSITTYTGSLMAKSYLTREDPYYVATEIGITMLGTNFEPLPTGAALREHWLARLPEGERKLLSAAISAYPAPVTNKELQDMTGYATRSVTTYVGKLRARKLLEGPAGKPTAAAILF